MRIGIVGNGFVGKATALLKCEKINVVIYDKDPDRCMPLGISLSMLKDCDFVFVCVPTPMNEDGSCCVSIVTNCVEQLAQSGIDRSLIVVRSTVPVGTCEKLGVNFMPEFLTEANWEDDFKNCRYRVFGAVNDFAQVQMEVLFRMAESCGRVSYINNFKFCSTKEAELAKYTRNCFLATKVSFFSEIEEFSRIVGADYETVRALTCLDDRIGSGHTKVPGPDGKRGFGGTCFPKDVASFEFQQGAVGQESYIIEAAKSRNNQVDRPEKDWREKGRSVV